MCPRYTEGVQKRARAASRRAIAFLTAPPVCVDAPSKPHADKMAALLKAYTGVDTMKQHTESNEDSVDSENDDQRNADIKRRLTSKEYFTAILPFLQYIGGFYTLIIDDTEFVTIKTANDTYLRVHVANFNGLYNVAGTDEYQMKCRMCDWLNRNVFYSSKGHLDRLHVMSLGHIKHVLTPVESIHGIRNIDSNLSLCVLCNLFLPTHSVEEHTMKNIQHTASLAEALERGREFKENKDDMKFLIYSSPPVDAGFFGNPPHSVPFTGFRLPHNFPNTGYGTGGTFGQVSSSGQSGTFGQVTSSGQGGTFGQVSSSGLGGTFGQSSTGQSVPFGQGSTGQSVPFGQVSSSGRGGTFGQSSIGQSIPFGQVSSSGRGGIYGQSSTGQSVSFGQSGEKIQPLALETVKES